ncbi:MAG: hypothetical protein AAGC54_17795, partial [Cyanobacteria bacterium P01_F01_bin.4]
PLRYSIPMRNSLASANPHRCSLCSDNLLRHIRRSQLYWFCPSCRQEMPEEKRQPEISAFSALNREKNLVVRPYSIYEAQPTGIPGDRHQTPEVNSQKSAANQPGQLAVSRG